MHGLYSGMAVWNLVLWLGLAVLTSLRLLGGGPPAHTYQLCMVFGAVFCCLVQSLLIIHFIGTMKWMQQSGPTAGIEDTKPLRTAWIRGRMFPVVILVMLLAVAAAILAGGEISGGGVSPLVPFTLAWTLLPLGAWGLVLARARLDETRARMDRIEGQMSVRIASGAVAQEEASPLLREESGRAGGKTLVFLAANVQVLFVYMRFVLRRQDEPWWPYGVATAVLALVGAWLWRQHRAPADAERR